MDATAWAHFFFQRLWKAKSDLTARNIVPDATYKKIVGLVIAKQAK